MMRSDSPPEYDSALSKKLTPASHAAARQSAASPSSSWGPKVTQEPNDSTLTLMPARPSRRYSISMGRFLSEDVVSDRAPVYQGRPAPTSPLFQMASMRTTSPVSGALMMLPPPTYMPTWLMPPTPQNRRSPGCRSDSGTWGMASYWAAAVRGRLTPAWRQDHWVRPEQ